MALAAAFAVGTVLYWLVERPFLKLRDRFRDPVRSTPSAVAAAPAVSAP